MLNIIPGDYPISRMEALEIMRWGSLPSRKTLVTSSASPSWHLVFAYASHEAAYPTTRLPRRAECQKSWWRSNIQFKPKHMKSQAQVHTIIVTHMNIQLTSQTQINMGNSVELIETDSEGRKNPKISNCSYEYWLYLIRTYIVHISYWQVHISYFNTISIFGVFLTLTCWNGKCAPSCPTVAHARVFWYIPFIPVFPFYSYLL
jgi:hypothetical protein